MSKKSVVVSCPIDTYSGYGARSRDFVKALLELDEYNVKVIGQRWVNCRFGYLRDHNEDFLESIPSLGSIEWKNPERKIQGFEPCSKRNLTKPM